MKLYLQYILTKYISALPVWNRDDVFGVLGLQRFYPLLHLSLSAGHVLYVEQHHIQLLLQADYTKELH